MTPGTALQPPADTQIHVRSRRLATGLLFTALTMNQDLGCYGDDKMGELKRLARMHLREAIALIPDEKKRAFHEANHKAPQLVEAESNPDVYLSFSCFNSWVSRSDMLC